MNTQTKANKERRTEPPSAAMLARRPEKPAISDTSDRAEISCYALPDLPYDLAALAPTISEQTMEIHYGTHHAAYVKGANEATQKLSELPDGEDPSQLLRSLALNASGHVLHSAFWASMTPGGASQPSDGLADAIERSFGDMKKLQSRLTRTVAKLQGSGWAGLMWEPCGRRLVVCQVHDHQSGLLPGATPVLVIDGWEHAYYLDYQSKREVWADAFWEVADWQRASIRFEDLSRGSINAASTMAALIQNQT